jgi:acyl-CoA thioester hydrolase
MGVVYHANYLVWFEVGRVELMRQQGLNYKRLETEEGCWIVVAEVTARYKAPARYDDELIVETTVRSVRGPVIRFGYMKRARIPKKFADLLSAAASHPHV